MEELTIQISITIVKTRNISCFTNSHESFQAFQFKYTDRINEMSMAIFYF